MDRITLDREVFKALASDTRLDILKALDVRQKTVTELAKELELNKATVFEHLEKLAVVGLIQKLEDDRKWVYWQLSWKGRRLLHPEKITLALLLSTAMGTLLTGMASFYLWMQSSIGPMAAEKSEPDAGIMAERSMADAPADSAGPSAATDGTLHDPALLALAVVLGLVFLALVGYAILVYRRANLERTMGSSA